MHLSLRFLSLLVVICLSGACQDCLVRYLDNYEYKQMTVPSGNEFSYTSNCLRYDCNCQCSGGYRCGQGVYDCPCKECPLDPRQAPGVWFDHIKGCEKSLCRCYCNGEYTCGRIEKIC